MFLSPTGGGLLLSPQKLSQRTADSTWLQVREPLETSTAPVLHVGTSEVTSGHRAGKTPSREEHSTLWIPEQGTWALSLKHSAPAPLVLLYLQPILQMGLMMVMLSVTVAGPCGLAWIGADDVTAWESHFTQSDFTPQQFLTAVFSIFS